MKNANSNITTQHTTHHGIFIPAIPGLVDDFKKFVAMVNDYLCFQQDDVCYHPSKTKGQARHRIITIGNDNWRFSGQLVREDMPYTDTAVFYYCDQKVWEMKRVITLLPSDSRSHESKIDDKVRFCILAVSKNYNQDIPWCGPRYFTDVNTGLHYEAEYYSNEDDASFSIEESIRDPEGVVVWSAVCEGRYED